MPIPSAILLAFVAVAGRTSGVLAADTHWQADCVFQDGTTSIHSTQPASAGDDRAPGVAGDDQTPEQSPPEPKTKSKKPAKRFEWEQRPSFRFGKNLRIDVEAKLHEDVHTSYAGADVAADLQTFELRRTRLGVQGEFLQHIEFEVEREFTRNDLTPSQIDAGLLAQSLWRDVYADADYVKRAQVRVGKFKIPFGLDELTSVTQNDFVYRSLGAEYLAPGRDIGVMVHGRFFSRGLNYWAGGFRHDGDNTRAKAIAGADGTWAARVTAAPLRGVGGGVFKTLEFGSAIASSALSNDSFRPNGLRGRTVMTQDVFFSPVYVNGRRFRWEGDIDWMRGSASMRAEYTGVSDDRLGQGLSGEDLPDARYRSWYVSGSYLLTGETKTRPVKPRHELLRGGAGALELAARYEEIRYDSASHSANVSRSPRAEVVQPSGEAATTIGVNWILNRWMSMQFNVIRERVLDAERSPVPNGAPFWSRVLQLQLVL